MSRERPPDTSQVKLEGESLYELHLSKSPVTRSSSPVPRHHLTAVKGNSTDSLHSLSRNCKQVDLRSWQGLHLLLYASSTNTRKARAIGLPSATRGVSSLRQASPPLPP